MKRNDEGRAVVAQKSQTPQLRTLYLARPNERSRQLPSHSHIDVTHLKSLTHNRINAPLTPH